MCISAAPKLLWQNGQGMYKFYRQNGRRGNSVFPPSFYFPKRQNLQCLFRALCTYTLAFVDTQIRKHPKLISQIFPFPQKFV